MTQQPKPVGASDARPLFSNDQHTLIDILRADASRKPDAEVFHFLSSDGHDTDIVTYWDLLQLIGCYVATLQTLRRSGSLQQDQVVLLLPPGKRFVAAFYACLALSLIAVPTFPPRNSVQYRRLDGVLHDLGDPIILSDRTIYSELAKELPKLPSRWLIAEEAEQSAPASLKGCHPASQDIALLQYSSGTTGTPKGVMVTQRNLIENSALIKDCFMHEEGKTRTVIWLPPYHDMGLVGGVLQGVYSSYPTLLMPTDVFLRNQFRWLEAISDFRATSSGGPNFAYELCLKTIRPSKCTNLDLSCWNVAFCGAEPIRYQTLRQFAAQFAAYGFSSDAFLPCYGMAESTLMVSGKSANQPWRHLEVNSDVLQQHALQPQVQHDDTRALVSCGPVHPSMEARIVHPELGVELPEGEIGEIWLSGPSITRGYWNRHEETTKRFNQTIAGSEGRFHRTGDLGALWQGELYVTGRIKELLIVRGANFYPQDLEYEAAQVCPELRNCRIVAISLEQEPAEQLVLIVEVPRNISTYDTLVQRIQQQLADCFGLVAEQILFVPRKTIRITSSGKLQRAALKAELMAASLPVCFHWQQQAQSSSEKTIVASPLSVGVSVDELAHWIGNKACSAVRQQSKQLDVTQPLTSIGLDSVAAMDILFQLESELNIHISPDLLYKHNTPMALAQVVHQLLRPMSEQEVMV